MTHECPYDGLYDAWSVCIFDILAKWVLFIATRSTCSSPALFGNYDWPTDRLTARNPQITGSMESYTSNNQELMINDIDKHDDVFPLICTAALGRGRDYSRLKQYRQRQNPYSIRLIYPTRIDPFGGYTACTHMMSMKKYIPVSSLWYVVTREFEENIDQTIM